MAIAVVLTGYLMLMALLLDHRAASKADHAVATLVWVLAGAAGIVAVGLYARWRGEPDADADQVSLPSGYQRLDAEGRTGDHD